MGNFSPTVVASWTGICRMHRNMSLFFECSAVGFTKWRAMAFFAAIIGQMGWSKHEVWKFLHAGCSQYPDKQQVLIDSTITRAHVCAAGAVGSSAEAEAWGVRKAVFPPKFMPLQMR